MAPRKNMFKLPENVHIYIFVAFAMAGIIASTTYISQQLINRSSSNEQAIPNSNHGVVFPENNSDQLPDRKSSEKINSLSQVPTDSTTNSLVDSAMEKKKKKKSPVF